MQLSLGNSLNVRSFSFKRVGRVGIESFTTRRSDPPSQNPPPGVRREDVSRDHESVPTPQIFEKKNNSKTASRELSCAVSSCYERAYV